MSSRLMLVLLPLALLGWMAAGATAAQAGETSVQDGVYSKTQAGRGLQVYREHCESCHAVDMQGGPAARGLVGLAFQFLWKDKTLAELLTAMRGKMPPGNPGSLNEAAYRDLLAAVLQRNGFPAGASDLPAGMDELQDIAIRWDEP